MVLPADATTAGTADHELSRLGWLKLADDDASEVSRGQVDPRPSEQHLPFETISTDGGEYSPSHSCDRLCIDDKSCYSSQLGRSAAVNVIAKYCGRGRSIIDAITVRTPKEGYNSPVGQAVIFASLGAPKLECIADFDQVHSEADYQCHVDRWNQQAYSDPRVAKPVAFVSMRGRFQATVPAAVPRSSRYLIIKLLRPQGEYDNIDVEYVGVNGWCGRRTSPCRMVLQG